MFVTNDVIQAAEATKATSTTALAANSPFTPEPKAPREKPTGLLAALQIRRGNLRAVKMLGAGQFGEVYLAFQRIEGAGTTAAKEVKRAVKMLKGEATPEARADFMKEAEMMVKLGRHPNLVAMVGVAVQQVRKNITQA